MRAVFILCTVAALPGAAMAGDAEGCTDLKQMPRLKGCVIQECSAKQHDSFETGDAQFDAGVNSLSYTCPAASAALDLERVKRELDAEIRKAGYQTITADETNPASPTVTARKGSHWLRWDASSEDGEADYSLVSAESASEKFKAEACEPPAALSPLKLCDVVECASKSEDSVAMRTSLKEETSLTGNVQTVTLACPSISPAQAFSTVEGELKASGFQILFSESAWITGRADKRWVELVSVPDGAAVSYSLTVVPSAEVLTMAKSEPAPAPEAMPAPAPVLPPVPVPAPIQPPQVATGFIPPSPILQVPLDPSHDLRSSVIGDVVINMLVDINEKGAVTKADLTGQITKEVLKLEPAALDAVWRWRFEPARQDGRAVAAVKIPVQISFRGRPSRY